MRSSLAYSTSLLLIAGALTLGLAACGSDDAGDTTDDATDTPAQVTGTAGNQETGNNGEFKPEKKAPESAGDRKPDAPDKDISKRPGGPDSPVKP